MKAQLDWTTKYSIVLSDFSIRDLEWLKGLVQNGLPGESAEDAARRSVIFEAVHAQLITSKVRPA
jgi:hypothetical protein